MEAGRGEEGNAPFNTRELIRSERYFTRPNSER